MAAHPPVVAAGVAVGVDVASAARLAGALRRRPRLAARVFTDAELADCAGRPERLAARWAAKEAVRKVYGARGWSPLPAWRDIEVRRGPGGAPHVVVAGRRDHALAISLSHEGDMAAAVAAAGPGSGAPEAAPHALGAGPDAPEAGPDGPEAGPDGPGAGPEGALALGRTAVTVRLPERPADGHKGTFGTVVVVAGSHAFSGAAYLAAMGAARGGAGLVRLCVPASLHPAMAVKCVEVMPHALPDGGEGILGDAGVSRLVDEHVPAADALVVGPGLGRAQPTGEALVRLLRDLPVPAVIDADALTLAATHAVDWRRAGAPVVLTPHPGEMGRLAGLPTAEVQAARREVAQRYAADRGAVVVLKGAETVVAGPDGRLHVDEHRVVALATGGTGDVLAGLCGAMVAGGLDAFEAAVAAVTVHAEAGAAVEAMRGRAGGLASDVLEALPAAQERLRRAAERAGAPVAGRGPGTPGGRP